MILTVQNHFGPITGQGISFFAKGGKNNLVLSLQFPFKLLKKICKAVFCICITSVKYIQRVKAEGRRQKNHLVTPWRSVISWIYTMTRRCFCAQWFHEFFSPLTFYKLFRVFSVWRNVLIVFDAVLSSTQLSTDSSTNVWNRFILHQLLLTEANIELIVKNKRWKNYHYPFA